MNDGDSVLFSNTNRRGCCQGVNDGGSVLFSNTNRRGCCRGVHDGGVCCLATQIIEDAAEV